MCATLLSYSIPTVSMSIKVRQEYPQPSASSSKTSYSDGNDKPPSILALICYMMAAISSGRIRKENNVFSKSIVFGLYFYQTCHANWLLQDTARWWMLWPSLPQICSSCYCSATTSVVSRIEHQSLLVLLRPTEPKLCCLKTSVSARSAFQTLKHLCKSKTTHYLLALSR